MTFKYFISAKKRLVVLSLNGTLDDKDGSALMRCLEEIKSQNPAGVVVYLGDVTSFSQSAFRGFANFFRELKTKCNIALLSSIKAEPLKALLSSGLISRAETKEELKDAVKEVAIKMAG
ncbi:MAG: STAS domain-containing protein [Bdellovibrionota bacterium]